MNTKRLLPVIFFVIGIVVFAGLYFFVIKGNNKEELPQEENVVAEIPLEKRPLTSLTPSKDGHYLFLKVKNIEIEAASLDYEILYQTEDQITQGVPGTVKLDGKKEIEAEILLGSESSGKFRYDKGVEKGTLTLRFRNDKGKLVGKLFTEFHLQNDVKTLDSLDDKFTYTLNELSDAFFVTMETFGLPEEFSGNIISGPYGVFQSEDVHPGRVAMDGTVHFWDGSNWEALSSNNSPNTGVFIGISQE